MGLYAFVDITDLSAITRIVGSEGRSLTARLSDAEPNYAELLCDNVATNSYALYPVGSTARIVIDVCSPDKLALKLNMDEGQGSKAYDESVNANHGILTNGPTWAAGKFGNGLSFDGVDDYATIPDAASLDLASDFSFSLWVKPLTIPASTKSIFSKGLLNVSRNWSVSLTSTGKVEFAFGDGTTSQVITGATTLSVGTWYHVAGTWNNTSKTLSVYVNNISDASNTFAGKTPITNANAVTLGATSDGNNNINAVIDEVRLWSRLLAVSEVGESYAQNGRLRSLYKFIIEDNDRDDEGPSSRHITLTMRDYFVARATGDYPSESYDGLEASVIVKAIVAKYLPYISTADLVDATTTTLQIMRVSYDRTTKEVLDLLATASGFSYYVDGNDNLNWHVASTVSSGITYTDAMILLVPRLKESLLPVKNEVLVLGGNQLTVDQSQQSFASSVSIHNKSFATSFVPTQTGLEQIELKISKVGAPANLTGSVVQDSAGLPTGNQVVTFSINADAVATFAAWQSANVSAVLTSGVKYWLVVDQVGNVSNTYNWFNDGTVTGSHAEKSGTWSIVSGSYRPAFKEEYLFPVIGSAKDVGGLLPTFKRKLVITNLNFPTIQDAMAYAQGKLNELKDVNKVFDSLQIYPPNALPSPSQTVRLNYTALGINSDYAVKNVDMKFEGGFGASNAAYLYDMTVGIGANAQSLAFIIADMKAETAQQAASQLAGDGPIIQLQSLDEASLPVTVATLTIISTGVSGSYVYGTAVYGSSDYA